MAVIVGRDEIVKLPTLDYYALETTPVKRHDANSPQVLETIKALHKNTDDHNSFVVELW